MAVAASLKQGVGQLLGEIEAESDFPVLSASIGDVMNGVDDQVCVQRLTNAILKDFSITLRILRTANSVFYNRSGRPIVSVSHAVALLGVDTVRDLAASLLLFEHFQRKSPGLKELILLSLLSANHAREAAARVGYPRREEAYLCGMFRNLGELVIAAYRPREYAEVLRRMREHVTDRLACQQVAGFTFEEMGLAVARAWRLPAAIADSISAELPRLTQRRYTDTELLRVVANFGHRLTTALYRRETRAARASVNLLLDHYGIPLGLEHASIRQIADAALHDTRETFALAKVPLDDLRFHRQSEAALASRPAVDAADGRRPEGLLAELTAEAEARLDADTEFDLPSFVFLIMEAIARGGPFDRVIYAAVESGGDRAGGRKVLRGTTGLGPGVEQVLEGFLFPAGAPPVAAAVLEKQDVWVAQLREGRPENSELVARLQPAGYGLLPVDVRGAIVGCLYFDRLAPAASQPLDVASLVMLKRLRDLLAAALAAHRPD